MKGISTVVTTSALVLITLALLSIVLPWAWDMMVRTTDALTGMAESREKAILGDVYFVLPPAINEYNTDQLIFVHNIGKIALKDVRLKMLDRNFNVYDLNFFIVRRDGNVEGSKEDPLLTASLFYPGDVMVGIVPRSEDYLGFQFIFQSREYSESVRVGG